MKAILSTYFPLMLCLQVIGLTNTKVGAKDPAPVHRAHAHNDYHHKRPLLDALDNGFGSVEADVFLVDGDLQVGHTRLQLSPERTLKSLYLDPLRERIRKNHGSVHGDRVPLTLLIDVKSDAEATYQVLDQQLTEYKEILAGVERGEPNDGPVVAIVSGNRAMSLMEQDETRYAGIDGRLDDLKSEQPAHLLPLISDNWGRHFKWRGEGAMSQQERAKLASIISEAHAKQRRVRFWATPDRTEVWAELRDAGVDLINTDDLAGLSKFLRQHR